MRRRTFAVSWLLALSITAAVTSQWLTCSKSSDSGERVEKQPLKVPQDYSTIQEAIDSARVGDVVLVAEGIYEGAGNTNLVCNKSITLRSERGPLYTVIDCDGSDISPARGIEFRAAADTAVLEGFTIQNGYSTHGAAVSCLSSKPVIKNCLFLGNIATASGGAIRCKGASPHIINCTMVFNSSAVGGGMLLIAGSSPHLEYCIIAYSTAGGAVYVSDGASSPVFTCCDIYGNEGGDWTETISDQAARNGNLNVDPLFCDEGNDDFRLQPGSPCVAPGGSCTSRMGILEAGCR